MARIVWLAFAAIAISVLVGGVAAGKRDDPLFAIPSSKSNNVDVEMILVGGTDGSGTRSIVRLLQQMGVDMVIEDSGTKDVHASQVGGWPPLVHPILKLTRSADYNINDIPKIVLNPLLKNAKKLMDVWYRRSENMNGDSLAGSVFGVKAPVSMLTVPLFLEACRQRGWRLRFVHALRDGRDMAFSANQSPVQKFYRDMHPYNWERWSDFEPARAVELWSEWNSQLFYWARKQRSTDENFDYLPLRLEDIVKHSDTRPSVLQRLGRFLRSGKSNKDICCMSRNVMGDMGSHTRHGAAKQVAKRFGKWHKFVEGKPAQQMLLRQVAATGLEAFKMEPFEKHWVDEELAQECQNANC